MCQCIKEYCLNWLEISTILMSHFVQVYAAYLMRQIQCVTLQRPHYISNVLYISNKPTKVYLRQNRVNLSALNQVRCSRTVKIVNFSSSELALVFNAVVSAKNVLPSKQHCRPSASSFVFGFG